MTAPLPQLQLSPRARLTIWIGFLAALSLTDLILTTIALAGISDARELNPITAWALEEGPLAAVLVKILGIEIATMISLALAPTPFARTTERALAGASAVFLLVNTWSALILLGVV